MSPATVSAAAARPASAKSCAWGLALVLSLGLLVQLPTLRIGFFADDYGHQLILRSPVEAPIPHWNLYDFGAAPQWAEFALGGDALLPWWTGSDWKIRFLRPLTSLSLRLDYALWNREPLGYHVTNLVLWMVVLVLVHRLYEALGLPPRVAILALLVFVLAHATSFPVGWIAHRSTTRRCASYARSRACSRALSRPPWAPPSSFQPPSQRPSRRSAWSAPMHVRRTSAPTAVRLPPRTGRAILAAGGAGPRAGVRRDGP